MVTVLTINSVKPFNMVAPQLVTSYIPPILAFSIGMIDGRPYKSVSTTVLPCYTVIVARSFNEQCLLFDTKPNSSSN